ncbi:uncharacterized protein A1O9_03486 [Exophiala aquamarina CBS 119918]|uniref:Cytochrome b mRNA-processing protein 4 n=1 Tax=Exophiala aquamarina CBS 119918 TaxID=1182545 RepID=A0A072PP87_9EURO|nr:uncharacterized protein A1O9_03486 [Exophiala aquamarina CBS 119918]KEF61914.1 hypothetical protein A1O9_03486 [Exophiala aquamarina CBS 119918]
MAGRGVMYAKMGAVMLKTNHGNHHSVTPSEGELFKRFNPELQKKNLEMRDQRIQNHEEFITQLKEYSKSDKPIWVAAAEAQEKAREQLIKRQVEEQAVQNTMRQEMRAQAQGK